MVVAAEDEDFNYRFNSITFKEKEGWTFGKPAILLHTSIVVSVYIKATGKNSVEMVIDEGAIYVTSNKGYNWKATTLNSFGDLYLRDMERVIS
ncbi:photosystem II stability/assembly factor HCF136, chloroplastic [Artemisia annua]|uniref:Photosystem II stability/assembly factor HCF136, chloroplastic n=1 Tax=Artemisia annua TaxID=35608 RepID=A0A2U1KR66_ARTAN|nr:photosystem II stability/assembly factor HCF136, chloroplastic [Artemisia annua]